MVVSIGCNFPETKLKVDAVQLLIEASLSQIYSSSLFCFFKKPA